MLAECNLNLFMDLLILFSLFVFPIDEEEWDVAEIEAREHLNYFD